MKEQFKDNLPQNYTYISLLYILQDLNVNIM